MSDKVTDSVLEARARLKNHFTGYGDNYVDGWEALWKKGDFLPWDKGFPNPALHDILDQRHDLIGTAMATAEDGKKQRKKALVPGCGRGFDALLLASFGFDAFGLEYSEVAVEACQKEARENGDKYPVKDGEVGNGTVVFAQGDFFKDDWRSIIGVDSFDFIWDYTFFCALHPSQRPAWALRQSQLLKPRGNLVCLEYPTYKHPATGGPPWASPSEAYMEHLSSPGEELLYDEEGNIKVDPLKRASGTALERVAHWQPERTHKVGYDEDGNVRDWVSIWRRRE